MAILRGFDGCVFCCSSSCRLTPTPTPAYDAQGRRIYSVTSGEVFMVVEARPGPDGAAVGRVLLPGADGRPDLQIQASRDLGDGSPDVCDETMGGVPAISPPRFDAGDLTISQALLDFACRFQWLTANDACTLVDASGEHKRINPAATDQFCLPGSGTATFPPGDTIVSVKVRNEIGELGPQSQMVVRVATPTPNK